YFLMKLALWLKSEGVSARDFAARVGTTEATISRLRNARAQPSFELAEKIMQATGGAVTPNDFLDSASTASPTARDGLSELRVLLVIAGGIAAYKSLDLIRRLRENGATVRVVLTRAGQEFVTPLSVGAITGAAPYTDLFDPRTEFDVGHIRLARDNDIVVVAPATADLMAKLANGHADDLATAVLLATNSQILLAPAMNPQMWSHPATQRNAQRLTDDGAALVGPNAGEMAEANEAGVGRMAEVPEILAAISRTAGASTSQALAGKHVIVTSGPTHEPIDPVRYIANRSSGKQGHAIAAAAARHGARVTLVSGPVDIPDPTGAKTVHVESADEMLAAVTGALPADIGIFAAAVADWRSAKKVAQKMKKQAGTKKMKLALTQNPDILKTIARGKQRPVFVVGFAAETENVIKAAQEKRRKKGCDWIVANDVGHRRGVMGGNVNAVHLVSETVVENWPEMGKTEVAERLIQRIAEHLAEDRPE
ncbi:MAG: bifunctional phosphopantothenoylcysteine decarboxylase/phosphopantothenate--cysteine ligase CoaBC, partial [Pseudomonadota bacterium]